MAANIAIQLVAHLADVDVHVWSVERDGQAFAQLVERGESGRCPVELVLARGQGRAYRNMRRARLAFGIPG